MTLTRSDWRIVQDALKSAGFDCGLTDGIPGDKTAGALARFVESRELIEDARRQLARTATTPSAPAPAPAGEPPWIAEARRWVGRHERRDNDALAAWLRSDGHYLGDPSVLPWCGDFVETAVRLSLPAEPVPENPYLARNWLQFGRECGLVAGAVAVFWRGSRNGTSGHVAFVVGADRSYVTVLGGNQGDSVSVARLDRGRLLGCRWPSTYPLAGEAAAPAASSAFPISTNEA